jgi:hypothetical protein
MLLNEPVPTRQRWSRLVSGSEIDEGEAPGNTAAAGFKVGVATAWRYVQEAIALLAAAADDLATAMRRIRRLAYAILDARSFRSIG